MAATHPFYWYLISVATVWITLVFPTSTLLARIFGQSVQPYLIPGLLISPMVLLMGKHLKRIESVRINTALMQLIGAGAIFLIALLLGWLLTHVLSYKLAAMVTVALTMYWIYQSVCCAQRVNNIHLEIQSSKISTPMKIVHLSDVHIGSRDSAFLQRVVDQTNSHNPDMVFITGDLVDLEWVNEDTLAPLSQLTSTAYMCTGNHEFDIDLEKCLSAIEYHGVKILRDEALRVNNLTLLGIDDRKRGHQILPVLSGLRPHPDEYSVLLYHRPDGWDAARENKIDLMLAGHTHGGQIWPFNYLVGSFYHNLAGHFRQGNQHLYVSSGTGTWGPTMRFLTRSEMTVIQLEPEASGSKYSAASLNHTVFNQ